MKIDTFLKKNYEDIKEDKESESVEEFIKDKADNYDIGFQAQYSIYLLQLISSIQRYKKFNHFFMRQSILEIFYSLYKEQVAYDTFKIDEMCMTYISDYTGCDPELPEKIIQFVKENDYSKIDSFLSDIIEGDLL